MSDQAAGADATFDGPSALYVVYHAWKGWEHFFTHTRDDAGYFAGELRDVTLRDANVLEIGFGSGTCLSWLKTQGAVLHGTEIIGASRQQAEAAGVTVLPVNLVETALERPGDFDTILAFDVFEHLTHEEIAANLDAMANLLKAGGRIVLRFPNGQSPFGLQPQMGDPTHKTALSKSVIDLFIAERPFRVLRYGPAYRFSGRGPATRLVRSVRFGLRKLFNAVLNFTYATKIPYDPVVVIVLEKTAGR